MRDLTSDDYAQVMVNNITDASTSQDPAYYGAITYDPDPAGTSNMAAIDRYGNGVSLTSTINL